MQDSAGCRAAADGGADRVELCCALTEGGLTPTVGLLEGALGASDLEVIALVRPRRGDFLYTPEERAVQLRDGQRLLAAGAHGLAVGALQANGDLDTGLLAEFVALAAGAPLTCHRAFDHCRDPFAALEQLIELGFRRVLTSGQQSSAPAGTQLLAELVQRAAGRIEVMAGAGVRPENVGELVRATGVPAVHLSATSRLVSGMEHRPPGLTLGGAPETDEFVRKVTDSAVVRLCRRVLS